ncbi:hypothetical protein ABW17_29205 [Mycobacterium nebraskense]|nr:hypothetical protein ABW17_29205 [Mycobacterium nebraskense]
MWDGGYGGWSWAGWILMAVVLVVVVALLITAVVVAVRYLGGGGGGGRDSVQARVRAAEDVLAERFARGEIDDDEYRKRVALLREYR